MRTLAGRSLIRVAGADAHSFLQGLATQDIPGPGDAPRFSALLSPQGKIQFDFFVIPAEGGYLLDCASASAPALEKRLSLFKLRADVRIGLDPALGVAVAVGDAPFADGDFVDPRLAALGRRAIVAANPDDDDRAYHARRIALGVAQHADDFGADEYFLLDVNYDALNGVSYRKGCFIGQETTSRMKRKSEAKRRTLVAAFDGPAPARGERVLAGEELLGDVIGVGDGTLIAAVRVDRLAAAVAPATAGQTALRLAIPAYLEAA